MNVWRYNRGMEEMSFSFCLQGPSWFEISSNPLTHRSFDYLSPITGLLKSEIKIPIPFKAPVLSSSLVDITSGLIINVKPIFGFRRSCHNIGFILFKVQDLLILRFVNPWDL